MRLAQISVSMSHKQLLSFLEKLIERVKLSAENLHPNEVHVFNVHAAYGHYQITIGPSKKVLKEKHPQRPVEINGAMHHLFVTKNHVAAHPTHKQIHDNLKGCIIMRDLTLHLKDPTGAGHKIEGSNREDAIEAREKINLAGDEGNQMLKKMVHTGKLAKETYKIIQEDILTALANKQYTVDE